VPPSAGRSGGITERTSETGVPLVVCVDVAEVVLVVEVVLEAAMAEGRASIDMSSNEKATKVITCDPPGGPFILSFLATFERI
jgi:hypothetical protein